MSTKVLPRKVAAAFIFGMLVCSTALLASDTVMPTGTLASSDEKFVNDAAQGGMLEVQLGQLAQEKGKRDDVKKFGEMMVADHGKANEDLKQVALVKGLTLPDKLDATHAGTVDSLAKLDGDQFDRAYIDDMVKDHKTDVSDFEAASKNLKDSDLKAFASRTLPVLRKHLAHIQAVDSGKAKK